MVVGHPLVLLEDPHWKELLKYCFGRNAYRGAGSDLLDKFIPSNGENSWSNGIGVLGESSESQEVKGTEDKEMEEAIKRLADLSLLGMGHKDAVFPETLDHMYNSCNDDMEWRVVL